MREKGSFVMHYLLLGGAIALEIFATTQLKLSEGFTKLGIAYATWSAVGIVATSVIAALAFGQKLTTAGMVGMALIVAGVLVVNLFGSAGH